MENNHFSVGPWTITVIKGHILRSKCEESVSQPCNTCSVCRYNIYCTVVIFKTSLI